MKPTFKTTAVALLVALGVTACGSDPKSNPQSETPTPINNSGTNQGSSSNNDDAKKAEEQARLDAEAKAKADEQARLDAKAKAKADEQARLDAEAKAKADEQARLDAEAKAKADEKARLEAEAKAKADEKARLEAEANNSKIANNDWRIFDAYAGSSSYLGAGTGFKSNLEKVGFIGLTSGKIDFNELSKNQLGFASGSLAGDFSQKYGFMTPTVYDKVDYAFVNQPYSTYGIVGYGDWVDYFGIVQSPSEFGIEDSKANTSIVGTATYKGKVLVPSTDATTGNKIAPAKEDGTVELNVTFKANDLSTVSGKIDSATYGQLSLNKNISGINWDRTSRFNFENGVAKAADGTVYKYEVSLGGKDLNDAIGAVRTDDDPINNVGKNIMVFGGTKQ